MSYTLKCQTYRSPILSGAVLYVLPLFDSALNDAIGDLIGVYFRLGFSAGALTDLAFFLRHEPIMHT